MQNLYEILKVLKVQKRMVFAETIRRNKAFDSGLFWAVRVAKKKTDCHKYATEKKLKKNWKLFYFGSRYLG